LVVSQRADIRENDVRRRAGNQRRCRAGPIRRPVALRGTIGGRPNAGAAGQAALPVGAGQRRGGGRRDLHGRRRYDGGDRVIGPVQHVVGRAIESACRRQQRVGIAGHIGAGQDEIHRAGHVRRAADGDGRIPRLTEVAVVSQGQRRAGAENQRSRGGRQMIEPRPAAHGQAGTLRDGFRPGNRQSAAGDAGHAGVGVRAGEG